MTRLWQDVRYAARRLQRAPIFSLAVIATLALTIGPTTAVFTVVNAVLLLLEAITQLESPASAHRSCEGWPLLSLTAASGSRTSTSTDLRRRIAARHPENDLV